MNKILSIIKRNDHKGRFPLMKYLVFVFESNDCLPRSHALWLITRMLGLGTHARKL